MTSVGHAETRGIGPSRLFACLRADLGVFCSQELMEHTLAILEHNYPSIEDLRRRAKRRIPHFAWEYLDSGTGEETALDRNRQTLDAITLKPRALRGKIAPVLETQFLGRDYSVPIGIAPIGATGMMWPGAEMDLARMAADKRVPYGLSTVATRTPDEIGPIAGEYGWFQLYPLGGDGVQEDILKRAQNAGYKTLVLTVDVPINSRRERQRRAGFNMPVKMTPSMILQMMLRPAWLMGIAKHGQPRFKLMEDYVDSRSVADVAKRLGPEMRPNPDWSVLDSLRANWDGQIILKGICNVEDAVQAQDVGIDAVWVSNHGGRQLDAAPGAITVLPHIREAVGPSYPLIYDSGVRSGLDVARALALGADFVMAGRAFIYGAGAFGPRGIELALKILSDDLANVMAQVGTNDLAGLRDAIK